MTVDEIALDIKKSHNGAAFINASEARRYLGFSKDKSATFLSTVPCYITGRQRKYSALDIARKMESIRTIRPYGA